MNRGVSIAKFNDHVANEDAFYSSDTCIAVSDGAGGCGLFANEWSEYLVKHLPKDNPIISFKELDEWVDGIWETFYNEHEERAKEGDGILLNKYYNLLRAKLNKDDKEKLKQAQLIWLKFRDSESEFIDSYLSKGGGLGARAMIWTRTNCIKNHTEHLFNYTIELTKEEYENNY